jgi:2-polyprenyl-6-hydroxyphenyl methylase / 3-demethylubiquinone-9 3-methyltransferase
MARRQDRTDAYFSLASAYWRDIYAEQGLEGLVYRERMQAALTWIDALHLKPGAKVLEVGCGAGLATMELALRGFAMHGTDSSAGMVALAECLVAEAGLGDDVSIYPADVHQLPHRDGSFELVLALGVLPWVHAPQRALEQVGRVLVPGGHAIVTADNRLRLNALVEPAENPLLVPAKYARRALRRARGRRRADVGTRLHTPARVDRWLAAAGLEAERRTTLGFGPFTFVWRPILPDRLGLRLHRGLDRLAAGPVPRLRRHGWHYLVSARRV